MHASDEHLQAAVIIAQTSSGTGPILTLSAAWFGQNLSFTPAMSSGVGPSLWVLWMDSSEGTFTSTNVMMHRSVSYGASPWHVIETAEGSEAEVR